MEKIAVFPGSFDPFTRGHEEIVKRGLKIFDRIIVAVGVNAVKHEFLSANKRMTLISKVFEKENRVEVTSFTGLTVNFCKEIGVHILIRGLRTSADFEFERAVGQTNRAIDPEIETVFILTSTENTFISSTIVRDVYMNGGNVDRLIPKKITTDYLRKLDKE